MLQPGAGGLFILWRVPPCSLAERLTRADAALAIGLNAVVRASPALRLAVSTGAAWLASVEVALMVGMCIAGGVRAAVRMLLAVAAVYAASELLGHAWQRRRPFASLVSVEALVPHAAGRSFPSRHVASGLAMATVAGWARPRTARVMSSVAWLLALCRVSAGLHYPTDALAGAGLGVLIGRALRGSPRPSRSSPRPALIAVADQASGYRFMTAVRWRVARRALTRAVGHVRRARG